MIIRPYSDTSVAQTPSDFPFVKFWMKCDDAAGATTLLDSVGNLLADVSSTPVSKPDAYSIALAAEGLHGFLNGGVLPQPGASPCLLVAIGKFGDSASGEVQLGNASLGGSGILIGNTSSNISDLNSGYSCTNATTPASPVPALKAAATVYGRAIGVQAYNSATGGVAYETDGTTSYSALATFPTDASAPGGIALPSLSLGTAGSIVGFGLGGLMAMYGIMLLVFAKGLPPANSLKAGLAWMTVRHPLGDKRIYPGWRGLL